LGSNTSSLPNNLPGPFPKLQLLFTLLAWGCITEVTFLFQTTKGCPDIRYAKFGTNLFLVQGAVLKSLDIATTNFNKAGLGTES
jgi:hypothetical protein